MANLLTVKEAATLLGVTSRTVRRWEREGKIKSTRTVGGHRRFDEGELLKLMEKERLTVGYVRVGSEAEREKLKRQLAILQAYRDCTEGNWEIIEDIGSGANYGNHGLLQLLDLLCSQRLERLVILNRASLPRLGSELIFNLCEIFQVEIVILNSYETLDSEAEWQKDTQEIFEQLSQQLKAIHQHEDQELKEQLRLMIAQLREKSEGL